MKKLVYLFLILFIFISCGPKQDKVERIIEDGVEVVVNHLEPYQIKGEPSQLQLERLVSIDTEDEGIYEIGLVDMETFDVDVDGNIYIICWESDENYIFKFDDKGNFIKSFAHHGQGPGEIRWGGTVQAWNSNTIMAKDPSLTKFLLYTTDGEFLREVHLKERFSLSQTLQNGSFLIKWQDQLFKEKIMIDHIGICNASYEKIAELETFTWPDPQFVSKYEVGKGGMIAGVSKDFIYIGHPDRDYEIWAYSLDGNLMRKIRKEYKSVEISEEYKDSFYSRFPEGSPLREKYVFRKYWGPFRYFITDDRGRLFVMTHEKGENYREFIYDVFTAEGAFLARTSLNNMGPQRPLRARIKGNHLYSMQEKESGYIELVVYKMKWE